MPEKAFDQCRSFDIIGQYLQDEVGCRVMVLGIQPAHNLPNTSLSRVIMT
jgi:hypothetical protein